MRIANHINRLGGRLVMTGAGYRALSPVGMDANEWASLVGAGGRVGYIEGRAFVEVDL